MMEDTPLKKWLDEVTITSNFTFVEQEVAIDVTTFYMLFKEYHPSLFPKEGYFFRSIKQYISNTSKKSNPKIVEIQKINYIVLGLKSDQRSPAVVTDINDSRIRRIQRVAISDQIFTNSDRISISTSSFVFISSTSSSVSICSTSITTGFCHSPTFTSISSSSIMYH